jgi:hypothetical protein
MDEYNITHTTKNEEVFIQISGCEAVILVIDFIMSNNVEN